MRRIPLKRIEYESYEIPFSCDLLIRPRLSLPAKFSVFGEAGLRYAYLDIKKESASSTRYSIREWTPGFVAGGGLQYDALPHLCFNVFYRYARLAARKTSSAFPDGMPWERVGIKSQTQSLGIGAAYIF